MYKLVLAYDGTHYFGWQKTRFGASIQEEIEKAVQKLTGEKVAPEAASRTDRGVHARGQVIQLELKKPWEPHRLLTGLNALLPADIRVLEATLQSFHPTLDAAGKEYHYEMCLQPAQDPMRRLYAWHVPYLLNRDAVARAALHLVGTHDFSALANEKEKNPICTLRSIEFDHNTFKIKGDRFLYKMARNLVGTLVYVARGKLAAEKLPEILASRDRKQAGVTAPAHGLYLHQVFYLVK